MSTPALWEFLTPSDGHGDPATTAVWARGHRIGMADGADLLCGTSGLWNVNFGYGVPSIARAVHDALLEQSYATLFRYGHRSAGLAAESLLRAVGPDDFTRVLFSTSGSAANDLTMKLLRQAAALSGERVRRLMVGLVGSYHGLTYGAHSLAGEDLGQTVYGVDQRQVRHVDPFDPDSLEALCLTEGDRICALFLEPVMGTGAVALPAAFLARALDLAQEYGFYVVADEVATGFHRTGPLRASAEWPRQPDVVVLSKGLTNGTCAAAALCVNDRVSAAFDRTGAVLVHGETQAGTPATAAAILATLAFADEIGAAARAAGVAARLDAELVAFADRAGRDGVEITLRGTGCFRGVGVRVDGQDLAGAAIAGLVRAVRKAGAVVHPGPAGVQLIPAITYSSSEVVELVDALDRGLRAHLERSQYAHPGAPRLIGV